LPLPTIISFRPVCFRSLRPKDSTALKIRLEGRFDAAQDASTLAAPRSGRETILLVEDEDAVRDLARDILQARGDRVLEARHGAEALSTSEQHPDEIHLLLTDVVMPEMSGRELAERLVVRRPTIKILYMSGYTANAVVHHGVLDPGTDFLQKPFTAAVLVQRVRESLDVRAAR
jgi:CheY-like chemotaxis protein